jgi:hypothetical protein
MFSMSLGLMSDARLACAVPSISPDPNPSFGLKFVVEMLLLSIGTPSTTNSGWLFPDARLRVPRMRMYDPAPGSPLASVTSTFGAFPASDSTMLDSLLRVIAVEST